ncbi:tetraacyldisaccharide 4'-kinase [Conchiformibius steedae]|uniref:Tetraacyldisaccharide 4'-kinase n=1 Tax=Conchiformibius steedae TaxID=153493 RepID=A0A3P2A2U0_9NEIS|nr:tetraacyldisaccharide 4'-kinase [Conchiformibius steedae]RRD89761.1 tetraacyldisaccharide 4'-kinase [Conchiformibius steedae]
MKTEHPLARHWQQPQPLLSLVLYPLARLFGAISWLRRTLYHRAWLKSEHLPVPVVVVGNLHAGGTGKTPITAALALALQQRGIMIGIVSRGYGRSGRDTHVLSPSSTAADAGDEPLLLYRQTHAPVAVAARRADAARALLARHPDIQIIISDDGLQHYALHRDVEMVVFPAADAHRRPDLLPNGALREPLSRLHSVDAIIFSQAESNHTAAAFPLPAAVFHSQLRPAAPYRFRHPADTVQAHTLPSNASCAAACAIARPERFFHTLQQMGFPIHQTHIQADHSALHPATLPQADYVFITEKDAVKLPANSPDNIWVLPVRAEISPDLADFVLNKLSICGNTTHIVHHTDTQS